MKTNILLAALALTLGACHMNKTAGNTTKQPDATNGNSTEAMADSPLPASMQMNATVKEGEAALLKFTVYNNGNATRQFCKWHTPFEPLISKYLEVKDASGEEMPYQGAMAKRVMPPPESSYIKLKANDSVSANVDVAKAFALKAPATYTVTYVGQNMSGVTVKESITFSYVK